MPFISDEIARVTRAVCAHNMGGYCECIGHDAHGCMVGYGEALDWRKCKMTAEAMALTIEYRMARGALAALYFPNADFTALRQLVAQGIEAGTDETLEAAQPEGQEPGPKDAPQHHPHEPRGQHDR